jgi:glucose-1-phosphate cytidylyltransferase
MEMISDVPVVVLCGGDGIYLFSDQKVISKGLVKINDVPLVQHLITFYYSNGFRNFILSCGKHFKEYSQFCESFKDKNFPGIKLKAVYTGDVTNTSSRVLQAIENTTIVNNIAVTYSDSISNVNLNKMYDFHMKQNKLVTLLAVHMPVRFRVLGIRFGETLVRGFAKKPVVENDWINGGFYFLRKDALKMMDEQKQWPLEDTFLDNLAGKNELIAYQHNSIWHALDNVRDLSILEKITK